MFTLRLMNLRTTSGVEDSRLNGRQIDVCEITARYGGLLKGSEKALVRVYIMPIT